VPGGGGLDAAERGRRKKVLLAAAELIDARASAREIAKRLQVATDVREPVPAGLGRWRRGDAGSKDADGARCKLTAA
jgi:hypothetical protein